MATLAAVMLLVLLAPGDSLLHAMPFQATQAPQAPAQTPAPTNPTQQTPTSQATPPAQTPAAPSSAEMTTHTSQTPFQSTVSLVPVRVVVRDSSGKVVTNLQREDFQVTQDGKPQIVAHFSVATPASEAQTVVRATPAVADTDSANVPNKLELPSRFVALLFDDVQLQTTDLVQARVAANKYIDSVQDPTTRFALFTSSGQSQTDFTDDKAAIHKAINGLVTRPIGVLLNTGHQCPADQFLRSGPDRESK